MAITVKELFERTKDKFHLEILAGKSAMEYTCTWVHMLEDDNVSEFFWGNELIVTSGYTIKSSQAFLNQLNKFEKKSCAGVVVNIGPYISEISAEVISFCEEKGLPLFVMPWEMSMTEFVRFCCSQITRAVIYDEDIAKAVMNMVRFPKDEGDSYQLLQEYFDESAGFQLIAVHIMSDQMLQNILEQRNTLRIHTAMRNFSFPFLTFRHEKDFLVILNQKEESVGCDVADKIAQMIRMRYPESTIHTGIGSPVSDLFHLSDSFHSAIAAKRRAVLKNQDAVRFSDMGFYQLFYSVPDDMLLKNYYDTLMEPLLNYEIQYNKDGIYTETLFRYLLADCSLKAVSEAMFAHENTVYYRMNKIRQILNNTLATPSSRQPYLMAYYCGVILGLVEEFEE